MTAQTTFVGAVEAYLESISLIPAPASVGDLEPSIPGDLPAVVLSLEALTQKSSGLGHRTMTITGGALEWSATIDLANPVLPAEPSFNLLSPDRKVLTLPHGGLVQRSGDIGGLSGTDLEVTVASISRTVVPIDPSGDEVAAEPMVGQLTFATALPATGDVEVSYFLGSWEQKVVRLSGVLRVDVWAADVNSVRTLGAAVSEAMLDERAKSQIERLLVVDSSALGSISPPSADHANARCQSLRFAFTFDCEINEPDSSGGIIQEVPAVTNLTSVEVDKNTGAINTTVVTESDLA
ncbi:MAG: hypothetical protein GY847_09105 [Proteobacteria bacterium]|nr:hypothetical protein [Pseudomonadota bacterium]